MDLSNLKRPIGSHRGNKRLGRGHGSGLGKTSGKGHKGQNARTGGGVRPGFEGGQNPLVRRLPKFGFTSIQRVEYQVVNLGALDAFKDNETVNEKALKAAGLIKGRLPVKILSMGKFEKKLTVEAHAFSKAAKTSIEKAGGKAVVLTKPKKEIEKK